MSYKSIAHFILKIHILEHFSILCTYLELEISFHTFDSHCIMKNKWCQLELFFLVIRKISEKNIFLIRVGQILFQNPAQNYNLSSFRASTSKLSKGTTGRVTYDFFQLEVFIRNVFFYIQSTLWIGDILELPKVFWYFFWYIHSFIWEYGKNKICYSK